MQLLAERNLVCAFSQRACGNMSLFYGDTKDSLNNRRDFLNNLGIDYRDLVCAQQIHGSNIKDIKEEDRGRGALSYTDAIASTDAFITDKKNLPLAIFTADCLSLFLFDPITPSVGLIHAGWRSTKEAITTQAIQLMKEKFSTPAEDLRVGFGPAIRNCCCQVGEEFNNFSPEDIVKRNGYYYLDLIQINKKQALELGVKDKNIIDCRICTSCQNKEFFSYRREGDICSRMMSVIMLL